MANLVWFRSDLRAADNAALREAIDRGGRVEAVFMVTPTQWARHDWGPNRMSFQVRAARALALDLASLGIRMHAPVVETFDEAPAVLSELVASGSFDAVFANREYAINEMRRDEAVASALACPFHLYDDHVLVPPESIRTGSGGVYTVYTPFRKRVERALVESLPPTRSAPDPIGPRCPATPVECPGLVVDEAIDALWPATDAEARLGRFLEIIDRYGTDRDLFAVAGTSALSPHLATGTISIRRCLHAALDAGATIPTETTGPDIWIRELLWREFYQHLLAAVPSLSMGRSMKPVGVLWRDDDAGLDAWKRGRTGVPIVDAAMRRLVRTGWMHNRLRMVVAMFLTKNLLIDWREGERHFMRHLVDADLASNNGGWQWSASTGADAAPYFRIFNPISQGRRFDPEGEFIRENVDELAGASDPHDPSPLERASLGYPEAIVDLRESRARAIDAFKSSSAR